MRFYLGTDRVPWLGTEELAGIPLFLSHHVLQQYVRLPRTQGRWALDSGGFTQLKRNPGGWPKGCEEPYIEAVRRYQEEIGGLDMASPQDWMCEPDQLRDRTVAEHQDRTVDNYLRLTELAPDLPWIPVIQGWTLDDYHTCIDLYAQAGIDLRDFDTVGIGSVCRRQSTEEIGLITGSVASRGLRLHGFGVKSQGLQKYGSNLVSADSMAWSLAARYDEPLDGCFHGRNGLGKCNHCVWYALLWRERLLSRLEGRMTAWT